MASLAEQEMQQQSGHVRDLGNAVAQAAAQTDGRAVRYERLDDGSVLKITSDASGNVEYQAEGSDFQPIKPQVVGSSPSVSQPPPAPTKLTLWDRFKNWWLSDEQP